MWRPGPRNSDLSRSPVNESRSAGADVTGNTGLHSPPACPSPPPPLLGLLLLFLVLSPLLISYLTSIILLLLSSILFLVLFLFLTLCPPSSASLLPHLILLTLPVGHPLFFSRVSLPPHFPLHLLSFVSPSPSVLSPHLLLLLPRLSSPPPPSSPFIRTLRLPQLGLLSPPVVRSDLLPLASFPSLVRGVDRPSRPGQWGAGSSDGRDY